MQSELATSQSWADDYALAQRAADGDRVAQNEVLSRVLDRVRKTVFYLAKHESYAEDIVQQSLVQILKSLGSFRGSSRLETWADTIAVRLARKALSKRQRRRSIVRHMDVSHHQDPNDAVGARQRCQHIAAVLQKIPEARRVTVVLRWAHGYSVAEIAEITDVPVNTVRDRLRVGKKELRKLLLKAEQRPLGGKR